ncbi:MAG: hypothetical protein NC918_00030 [Candidatus Omnitrophica bacterium]|nr:hypothetical protein [Candidatus Omnitrophota bacterium]
MSLSIEFLVVFLLTLSIIFILLLSFNNILEKSKNIFFYNHNSRSLYNFSLFSGLSYCYSSSVSFPYSHKNLTFNIIFNKIQYNSVSMDWIGEINLGGFFVQSIHSPI